MTFSIAVPVHNGEKFLELTLASALNQKRPPDEIVALDDASSDRSEQIIKSEKWGGRVMYLYNRTPSGYADAWNRIVKHTHSDFVTILHQDDLLDPDYLFHIERALHAYPQCRHIYAGYYYIDEYGNHTGASPLPHSAVPELIPGKEYANRYLGGVVTNRHIHRCPGVTTERRLLLETCSYRKEAGLIADDDFFLRVGEFTDVIGISEPLASFRSHSRSVTGQLKSISHTLARDYLFQTQYYQSHTSMLNASDIRLIHNQTVRFINDSLIESFVKNNTWLNEEARMFRREFEDTVPDNFIGQSSAVARLLWMISKKILPGSTMGSILSTWLQILLFLKKNFSTKI
ncbi:MAG: glycosyltransferase family 2 protein [Bacteroidota bacterium]